MVTVIPDGGRVPERPRPASERFCETTFCLLAPATVAAKPSRALEPLTKLTTGPLVALLVAVLAPAAVVAEDATVAVVVAVAVAVAAAVDVAAGAPPVLAARVAAVAAAPATVPFPAPPRLCPGSPCAPPVLAAFLAAFSAALSRLARFESTAPPKSTEEATLRASSAFHASYSASLMVDPDTKVRATGLIRSSATTKCIEVWTGAPRILMGYGLRPSVTFLIWSSRYPRCSSLTRMKQPRTRSLKSGRWNKWTRSERLSWTVRSCSNDGDGVGADVGADTSAVAAAK
mmetsp:Transcript_11953/g.38225  ORF Transcript_11953/g.38225 Transcript_11953/m.38225 type:complete len:288 (-) Transcript_11953:717-1580(-)